MKIDLIMPIIQDKCKSGYLQPNERQTLSELAEQQGIDKAELEAVLTRELDKVRKEWLNNLFKAAKQPDAALSDKIMLFKQSGRYAENWQFEDEDKSAYHCSGFRPHKRNDRFLHHP